ncbi:MAG TPA: Tn3 family transposase [Legionella sp.]|nr:Tn3 family transposase [Legionella sp.]
MSFIEVLPDHEVKRFSRPPVFAAEDRKQYFKLDEIVSVLLKNVKDPCNKVGLLLQYGYFRASGKFYMQKLFKVGDIKYVAKTLGIELSSASLSDYIDRTRQKHRLLILEGCGHVEFSNAKAFFEEAVEDMVNQQMHPRKLCYLIVERLRNKKIELPSYDRIVKTITEKFNAFERNTLHTMSNVITQVHQEALDHLTITTGEYYERPLLTQLKTITQSMRPKQIKHGIRNFLIIKKLFNEIKPIIDALSLSAEATKYYAQWVIKAKVTQITDMVESNKRYLYLVAFIDHTHRIWQDTLVDILLKSVQQQLNKAAKKLDNIIKDRAPDKNKLSASVLSGFNETQSTVNAVRTVLHDDLLNDNEKIERLYKIVPEKIVNPSLIQAVLDADKLKDQINSEDDEADQFDILTTLSVKLQNRVADIVKHLEFEVSNNADPLYSALAHYQSEKNITSTAPNEFLDDHEYKAIYKNNKFNISLYKALLFCKIASAVKSGKISLLRSYRYLSIEGYLIDEQFWQENKQALLEKFGLSSFSDIEQVLPTLSALLNKQYIDVNERILHGKNQHVTVKKEAGFSVYTPAVEKPDYDSITTIIGKDRYVPILQMMAEMNGLSKFTSNFTHHKIKDSKENPENEIFYAGIFALGSNIGLHKLANTAVGINYNTLSNAVNWYFSLENLHMVNQTLTDLMAKLWLPNKFKREKNLLHTSSDAKKQCVSVESLNANHSYKYFGNGKGANVYRFIDERGILFYTTVFSSSERDAASVIDGLLHNDSIQSDMHSTDTHGYTEMIFAVSHLIGVTFAPRIKDISSIKLASFNKIKPKSAKEEYPVTPGHYIKESKIRRNWDTILRLIATIMLRKHRASTILKRLSAYVNQHPLEEAIKEFGRVIKSIFILKYIDDVTLRQTIEKQLNKGELANKFASAVSFVGDDINEAYREDQEISAMCKTIVQNIIILWNYIELTKIIMRSDNEMRKVLLENITSASILTWQHVNLYGTYDFSNLLSANDPNYSLDEVINFTAA